MSIVSFFFAQFFFIKIFLTARDLLVILALKEKQDRREKGVLKETKVYREREETLDQLVLKEQLV